MTQTIKYNETNFLWRNTVPLRHQASSLYLSHWYRYPFAIGAKATGRETAVSLSKVFPIIQRLRHRLVQGFWQEHSECA